MRSGRFLLVIAIGVLLLVCGGIVVAHYNHAHHLCTLGRTFSPGECRQISRRRIAGFILAAIGLVALVVSLTEKLVSRR